ncbi:MAG: hypothetical protein M1838_006062 [Thelocarpon superellum]|nr:MAG: hypothetical protein M1838_006062 [Thelocarpon superellum]
MRDALALAFMAALASSEAIQLLERRGAQPAVIGMDIERKHVSDPHARDRLRRRASIKTVSEDLDNMVSLYVANVSLGTPPQQLSVNLDTGSSDLWTNAPNSQLCRSGEDPCAAAGVYSANSSSSYIYLNSNFNISYADSSGAEGDYATDTFVFGGHSIPKMQFGIGYASSSPQGILGIGYPDHEAQVIFGDAQEYRNFPETLVSLDLIQSPAYSLWLNDLDANTGSILFGGVDTDKYHGDLSTLPIQLDPGSSQPEEFFIALTGLSLGGQSIGGARDDAVLLDSGSSLAYLPDDLSEALYKAIDAQYDPTQGLATIDCSVISKSQTLDFSFSGATISVPMAELAIPVQTDSPFGDSGEAQLCLFAIEPAGQGPAVLGDPFLRSAYVVYDLGNNEISLAQTVFNATSSSVKEIGSGKGAVPGASTVTNAATASPGETGGRLGVPTISATAFPSTTPTHTGAAVALGVTKMEMGLMGILAGALAVNFAI